MPPFCALSIDKVVVLKEWGAGSSIRGRFSLFHSNILLFPSLTFSFCSVHRCQRTNWKPMTRTHLSTHRDHTGQYVITFWAFGIARCFAWCLAPGRATNRIQSHSLKSSCCNNSLVQSFFSLERFPPCQDALNHFWRLIIVIFTWCYLQTSS